VCVLQWKGFSIYGLVEAQVGGDIYSQTAAWGYSENQGRTALSDQAGVPDELKKPTVYNNAVGQALSDTFIFDGTFYKLRELAVKYSFNQNQLGGIFGGILKKLSIGFIGRNLWTIDNYDQGFDPEVGQDGGEAGSAVISKVDGFLYPNFKSLSGTLEFNF